MGTIKEYLSIDTLASDIFNIYKEVVDDRREEYGEYLDENYPEDILRDMAIEQAIELNDDMGRYLHDKDHNIPSNFNDIDRDYYRHVTGKFGWDRKMVDGLLARLDANDQSERTKNDREWLVEWFWETFGGFGLRYNFATALDDELDNVDSYKED